ncbi:DUF1254 domain-containing protein [Breoghania sp. L-A4]|uniref:DUF1254 domain-containing protein n=1 Tax=Breoghania sp. L-A4 TaxID=2304600 RepID=UPI000E35F03B|nr:DUF1254 domain-containing protein [Breoghania sp. L-A4]AXS39949.1 DUF1254 domain-containing protein [Breoghania sp. L-A4]
MIRQWFSSLWIWVLGGIMLAAVIHLLAVMNVPDFTTDDAFTRAARFGPDARFNVLPAVKPGAEPLPMLDPHMAHAACRFSLERGPVRMDADVPDTFWSFSLFDQRGETTYSFNNRTSGDGKLAMLVLTPAQLSILRENPPDDLERLIVIETPHERTVALLRAFVPDAKHAKPIRDALANAKCMQNPLGADAGI